MKSKVFNIIIVIMFILILGLTIYTVKKIGYKADKISEDEVEIERKWLIDKENIPYNLSNADIYNIEQTYICFSPEVRVRKINNGEQYTFTLKTNMSQDGMTRDETDIEITKEEYENLVSKKEGNTIYKTRYQIVDENNNVIAIDIFSGDLEGLAYLEIEFPNEKEAKSFTSPSWVIKEVTDDINYKNGYLARYGIPND